MPLDINIEEYFAFNTEEWDVPRAFDITWILLGIGIQTPLHISTAPKEIRIQMNN